MKKVLLPRLAWVWVGTAVCVAIAVAGATWGLSRSTVVYTASGARFVERVQKKDAPLIAGNVASPVGAKLLRLAKADTPDAHHRTVIWFNVFSLVVLFGLLLWALPPTHRKWALPILGLAVPMAPALAGHLGEFRSFGFELLALWAPTAIFVAASRTAGGLRFVWFLLGGLVAGVAVYSHPLGIWTSLSAFFVFFLVQEGTALVEEGRVSMPSKALELGLSLAVFGAIVLGVKSKTQVETQALLNFWFDGFEAHHPAFASWGTVFHEAADTAPPFWTMTWRCLVQTPTPLLLLGLLGLGVALPSLPRIERRAMIVLALPAAVVWLVSSLSGSGFYAPGVDGWALLVPFWAVFGVLGACWLGSTLSRHARFGPLLRWVAPVTVLLITLTHLVWIQMAFYPSSGGYANLFAGGTARFLAGDNTITSEPRIEEDILLNLPKGKRLIVIPNQPQVAPALELGAEVHPGIPPTLRQTGPYPILMLRAPAAPGYPFWQRILCQSEEGLVREIAGATIWKLFPAPNEVQP